MAKIATTKSRILKPGGVDEYIAKWPAEVRTRLLEMRSAVQSVVPDALETTSYFDMPGYSYLGYSYNGMFAWFSYKAPFVRLHVRPEAITRNAKHLSAYKTTKALINFPINEPIPKALIKKLVTASLKDMKSTAS